MLTRDAWGDLQFLKKQFPVAPVLLMSATICEKDVTAIKDNLGLTYLQIVRQPQAPRTELTYAVCKKSDKGNETMEKLKEIIDNAHPGHCIIYCATPDKCSKVFEGLAQHVDEAELGIYHGKLDETEKDNAIQRWWNGTCHTMIATSAFGMGIDMPNVRHVVHYVFPMSMSKCLIMKLDDKYIY